MRPWQGVAGAGGCKSICTIDRMNDSKTLSHAVESRATRAGTYVLMTAAYNEQENIERTIQSVVSQGKLPESWVIASDGSTDETDEIIESYARRFDFIRYLRISREPGRSFRSKVVALRGASKLLEKVPAEFIGNLDADVTVDPFYYAELINLFNERPLLGLAGGYVCEEEHGEFKSRRSNRVYSVAHAAQLARRECYEQIGGYAVLEYGGEDWHAQVSAKMHGWDAEAFPALKIYHHRHTGEGDNLVRHKFRQGRMDYSFGSHPIFEILKCLERFPEKPIVVGSMARMLGFFWSSLRRETRPVTPEFIRFLRKEQVGKMARWQTTSSTAFGQGGINAERGENALPVKKSNASP